MMMMMVMMVLVMMMLMMVMMMMIDGASSLPLCGADVQIRCDGDDWIRSGVVFCFSDTETAHRARQSLYTGPASALWSLGLYVHVERASSHLRLLGVGSMFLLPRVPFSHLGRFGRSEWRVSDAPAASPVRGCRRFVFRPSALAGLVEASAVSRGRDVTAASGGHGLAGAGGLFVAATVQNEDTNSFLHLPQLLSNR